MAEQEVKSEKAEDGKELEHTVITFDNKTTGDEIVFELQEMEGGRLDISVNFAPEMGKQDQHSIMGNCAMAVLEFIR